MAISYPPMAAGQYIDFDKLASLDAGAFQGRSPYPWLNEEGLLHDDAFAALRAALPTTSCFETRFGHERKFGQQPHDRYSLEYRDDLDVATPWKEFVAELKGKRYREWLANMLGTRNFKLAFHWHYTPTGCSVSPHCDAKRKLGSHIFYFNTATDWDAGWGGETVILDDGGRFSRRSNPAFSDFANATESRSIGNYSLLFRRNGNSWHGVRPLTCPEEALRKVFIVVINRLHPVLRLLPQS